MYSAFRNEILKNFSSSQWQHRAVAHPLKNFENSELFTDYFWTPEKRAKCLVHISGVHGVEGYLGSLIQREILKESFHNLPFQIVIVHAVNPYGMAARSRTNAENVDLNRNFREHFDNHNPNYQKFLPFLETGRWIDFLKTLPAIAQLGIAKTVETVACGQMDFPEGPFYAGHEVQAELLSLRENLKSIVAPNSHLFVLDVHTGLGKMGEETLILDGFGPKEEKEFFERTFSAKTSTPGDEPGSYRAEGPVSQLLKKEWPSFHVFEEFGTYSALKVLNALIHRDSQQLMECFFPQKETWRKKCTETGLLRFHQLVQTLS